MVCLHYSGFSPRFDSMPLARPLLVRLKQADAGGSVYHLQYSFDAGRRYRGVMPISREPTGWRASCFRTRRNAVR